jgi:hypothetical protein
MKVTAIACKTIEDEVNKAMENSGGSFQIHWIESGLHYHPEKLKNTLQECIGKITDSKYILLLFGLCGNALLGLELYYIFGASRSRPLLFLTCLTQSWSQQAGPLKDDLGKVKKK